MGTRNALASRSPAITTNSDATVSSARAPCIFFVGVAGISGSSGDTGTGIGQPYTGFS
jgi:hypothetical protein